MLDVRQLRRRLARAAFVVPVGVGAAACGSTGHEVPPGETATGEDQDPSCELWREGREGHWCGPVQRAVDLSDDPADEAGACPPTLAADKVVAQEPRFKRPKVLSGKIDVPLFEGGTLKASVDCGEQMCCYLWIPESLRRDDPVIRVIRGRPLVDGRRVLSAGARPSSAWAAGVAPRVHGLSRACRDALAEHWLDGAAMEHASVASFARAAQELMAVGAPAALVRGARQAAVDEVRHAQLCYGLASAYAGEAAGPGPLEPVTARHADLATVAVTTLLEGAVGESIATLEALHGQHAAADPVVAEILASIAEDEARHAELGWATVGWCVRTGGAAVVGALAAAAAAARPAQRPGDLEVSPSEWARYGVVSASEHQALATRAWREIVDPLLVALATGGQDGRRRATA